MEQLTDLVLVDILAALPMSTAIRVAQLGNTRLRDISCRAWVTARVTGVDFPAAKRASLASGQIREAFYSTSVLKRLYGRVNVCIDDMAKKDGYEVLGKIPGFLHFYLHYPDILHPMQFDGLLFHTFIQKFFRLLPSHIEERVKYFTNEESDIFDDKVISWIPSLVFEHYQPRECETALFQPPDTEENSVYYRPTSLNGRHLVDVLVAVCRPPGVLEAALPRARRVMTEEAKEVDDDVWRTVHRSCLLGK